jgi:hypothetical protein
MKLEDVDSRAVTSALGQMEPTFRTRELSTHPMMLAAHRLFSDNANYHGTIGRYLSENRAMLDLRQVNVTEKSNAHWRKVGHGTRSVFAE